MKNKFGEYLDLEEFSNMKWYEPITSILKALVYCVVSSILAIFTRIPALVFKMVGMKGITMGLTIYLVMKGASMTELFGLLGALGVNVVKTVVDKNRANANSTTQTEQDEDDVIPEQTSTDDTKQKLNG